MNKPQIGLKSMKAGRLREMRMNMNELREWQDKVYKSGMGFQKKIKKGQWKMARKYKEGKYREKAIKNPIH